MVIFDMKARRIKFLRKKICHFGLFFTRDYFGNVNAGALLSDPDFTIYGLSMKDALKRRFRHNPGMFAKVSSAVSCLDIKESDFAVMKINDYSSLTFFSNRIL